MKRNQTPDYWRDDFTDQIDVLDRPYLSLFGAFYIGFDNVVRAQS